MQLTEEQETKLAELEAKNARQWNEIQSLEKAIEIHPMTIKKNEIVADWCEGFRMAESLKKLKKL